MPSIERAGTSIHYDDIGDGPVLVLGHSFLCSGEMWAPQVAALSSRYRLINIDWPGHGRSGPATRPFSLEDLAGHVIALLDHLGIERVVWAGLSIGGMVALRGTLARPDRVDGLVLLDTTAGDEAFASKLKFRMMGLVARTFGIRPLLPSILPLMFGATTRRERANLVDEWRSRIAAADVPSMLHTLDALMARESLLPRLPTIDLPALVMVGDEDAALPPENAQAIAAHLPQATLDIVPKAGHLTTLERPEVVNEAMTAFLSRIYPTAA